MKNKINYLIYFIIFSFIGALIEAIFSLVSGGQIFYYWRSLFLITGLKIPFIPFYGIVFLLLFLLQEFLNKRNVKFYYWGFLNAILIVSYEYILGLAGLLTFNGLLWDYTAQPLNFMGIISLPMFILWVIGGYIFSLIYILWKNK